MFLGERPVGSGVGSVSGAGRMHLSTPVERPDLLGDGDDHVVAVAFNVDGVTFAGADNYRFVLAVNGSDRQTLRFRVADYRG